MGTLNIVELGRVRIDTRQPTDVVVSDSLTDKFR